MADRSIDESSITNSQLNELRKRVDDQFRSRFGRPPTVLAAAPGRVNLIGEHIDYNDGFVLPMAIERYVMIAAATNLGASSPDAEFYSSDLQENVVVPVVASDSPTLNGWGRYIEGVVAGFASKGVCIPPFQAVIGSSVPNGGGLSSSAALEVATATMIEAIAGQTLKQADKALLCQYAEHRFAGVPCGIMDQFSSVFGMPNELMLLDCTSQEIRPVSFLTNDISVLITNSNVKHELSGGEYAERRRQCESGLMKIDKPTWRDVTMADLVASRPLLSQNEFACGRHVVTEIQRTLEAVDAFESGQWERVGELMYASHDSLQHDYRVSCDELDLLVKLARELGVAGGIYGSRMTGGGFGGCTVTLMKTDQIDAVRQAILSQYESETGIQATSFASRPARGAHLMEGTSNAN